MEDKDFLDAGFFFSPQANKQQADMLYRAIRTPWYCTRTEHVCEYVVSGNSRCRW